MLVQSKITIPLNEILYSSKNFPFSFHSKKSPQRKKIETYPVVAPSSSTMLAHTFSLITRRFNALKILILLVHGTNSKFIKSTQFKFEIK